MCVADKQYSEVIPVEEKYPLQIICGNRVILERATLVFLCFIPGADPENSERGGRKMSGRERNIAPYPQHATGSLGPIVRYHSKDSRLQNFFMKSERGGPALPPSYCHTHCRSRYKNILKGLKHRLLGSLTVFSFCSPWGAQLKVSCCNLLCHIMKIPLRSVIENESCRTGDLMMDFTGFLHACNQAERANTEKIKVYLLIRHIRFIVWLLTAITLLHKTFHSFEKLKSVSTLSIWPFYTLFVLFILFTFAFYVCLFICLFVSIRVQGQPRLAKVETPHGLF